MFERGVSTPNSRKTRRTAGGVLVGFVLLGGSLTGCGNTAAVSPGTNTEPSTPVPHETKPQIGAKASRDNEQVQMFRTTPPLLSMINIMVCQDGRLDLSTVRQFAEHGGGVLENTTVHQYRNSPYCDGDFLTSKGEHYEPAPLPMPHTHPFGQPGNI